MESKPHIKRILVTDDEPCVREVIVGILESAGYDVLQASDGREAIDIVKDDGEPIDCVTLDLSMSQMDGDEVFNKLVEMRSDTRVVLISGFMEQEVMGRFQSPSFAGFVQKPIEMQVLLNKVAEALRPTLA